MKTYPRRLTRRDDVGRRFVPFYINAPWKRVIIYSRSPNYTVYSMNSAYECAKSW